MTAIADDLQGVLTRLTLSTQRAAVGRSHWANHGDTLPRTRLDVLDTLVRHGPSTPAELSDHLGLSRHTVLGLLRAMAPMGLVNRARMAGEPDQLMLVAATPHGEQVLTEHRRSQNAVIDAAIDALPAADREQVMRALVALQLLCDTLDHEP